MLQYRVNSRNALFRPSVNIAHSIAIDFFRALNPAPARFVACVFLCQYYIHPPSTTPAPCQSEERCCDHYCIADIIVPCARLCILYSARRRVPLVWCGGCFRFPTVALCSSCNSSVIRIIYLQQQTIFIR